jgi:hypothetical protein
MSPFTMPEPIRWQTIALGLLGAAVGGFLGYCAFFWIARHGFYALMLPPGLLGYGAGLGARQRSTPLAIFCGVAGLALGLFTEWRFAPFTADKSLGYFLTHVQSLQPMTMLMLAVGAFLGYRLALGRNADSRSVIV